MDLRIEYNTAYKTSLICFIIYKQAIKFINYEEAIQHMRRDS